MNGVRNTIFDGIATKDCEDTVTELLVNLMGYKYLRDFILDFLLKESSDFKDKNFKDKIRSIAPKDIDTQKVFPGYGENEGNATPDIVIENENVFIMIENKVNSYTEVQSSQLNGYIRLLDDKRTQKSKNCEYIFLIPDDYTHKQEIENKINEREEKNIKIKEWHDLLDELYKNDFVEDNPVVENIVKYFISHIDLNDFRIPRKKSIYEIAWNYEKEMTEIQNAKKTIGNFHTKIGEIQQNVVECLKEEYKDKRKFKVAKSDRENPYQFTAYIGYKKNLDTTYSYNIGICCSFGNENGKIELCIKENAAPGTNYDRIEEGWAFFSLKHVDENEKICNDSQVVKECVDLIKQVYKPLREN